MKIALVTYGSRGDIQPLLCLAIRLKEKGHTPTLCAPIDFKDWVKSFDINFQATSDKPIKDFMLDNSNLVTKRSLKTFHLMMDFIRSEIPQHFKHILPVAEDADLMVGASLQFAGASLAEYCKVPYHYIAFCPRLFRSNYHPPMSIRTPDFSPSINRQLWKMEYWLWESSLLNTVNQERIKLNLSPIQHLIDGHMLPAKTILAAYPQLAPLPEDIKDKIYQVGAFHLPVHGELPDDLKLFLASGSPPIYFGFGSMTDEHVKKTTQMVLNIATKYGLRFLISKGWAGMGVEELPLGVHLLGKVPHPLLFPHVSAVIHHGGAGTTATAARAGVPQIIIPHLLDQYYWGHQIFTRKLGPKPITKEDLTEARLSRAIFNILETHAYSHQANMIGQQLQIQDGVEDCTNFLLNT